MERSNWKDPNNPRRYRIFIPLAVALVVVAGAIVALNSKVVLTAFGGAQNCPSASPSAGTGSSAPAGQGGQAGGGHHWRWHRGGPGGQRWHKGGETVRVGATPAASPTAPGAPPVPAPNGSGAADPAAAAPAGANMAHAHRLTGAKAAGPSASPADSAAANGNGAASASAAPGNNNAGNNNAGNNNAGNNNAGNNNAGNNGQAATGAASATPAPSAGAGQSAGASAAPSAAPSASASPCPPQGGAQAANPNANCTLIVPANPLTAKGLATPYQLTATDAAMGPCNEANANQSAFVQATIIDPATGKLSVYSPLVVDKGTQPAAAPVVPALPANAVVGVWFGYNGDNLTLQDNGGSLAQGKCVNGLNGSVFGQFAYCNAPAFFTAANNAIKAGNVTVPPLGTANDGMPCMSTREFALIDQDQSDNVQTQYLANGNGQIAQSTAANKANMANATTLANPSDNALLDVFVDPALGCSPWKAPDLANNGAMTFSLALDELQAAAGQAAPVALVPLNDPMVQVNGNQSRQKDNLYRAGVDMPPLPAGQTPQQYCQQMDTIQAARLQKDQGMLANQASPMADAANSLFTFLGMRLQQSFGNLNCQNFGLTNPVSQLAMQGNVVVGVTFANGAGNGGNGNGGNAGGTTASPSPTAGAGAGRHHRRHGPRH